MKRYIHSKSELDLSDLLISKIQSVVLVGDIDNYNPRDYAVYSSTDIDYSTLTREQLLQLHKKQLQNIHDVRILRKLHRDELSIQQQREVMLANKENFQSTIKQVKSALQCLKDCTAFRIWNTTKNNKFTQKIWDMGGRIRDDDAYNIIQDLHVSDYSYSTYSYIDSNWNALLLVFEYKKPYTFSPKNKDSDPVTVNGLDIYIKIDVDTESEEGYAVMSFHEPEGKMSHPYKDYPIDKD